MRKVYLIFWYSKYLFQVHLVAFSRAFSSYRGNSRLCESQTTAWKTTDDYSNLYLSCFYIQKKIFTPSLRQMQTIVSISLNPCMVKLNSLFSTLHRIALCQWWKCECESGMNWEQGWSGLFSLPLILCLSVHSWKKKSLLNPAGNFLLCSRPLDAPGYMGCFRSDMDMDFESSYLSMCMKYLCVGVEQGC